MKKLSIFNFVTSIFAALFIFVYVIVLYTGNGYKIIFGTDLKNLVGLSIVGILLILLAIVLAIMGILSLSLSKNKSVKIINLVFACLLLALTFVSFFSLPWKSLIEGTYFDLSNVVFSQKINYWLFGIVAIVFLIFSVVFSSLINQKTESTNKPKDKHEKMKSPNNQAMQNNQSYQENQSNVNMAQFGVQQQYQDNSIDQSFTSTPNEETVNIADKIKKLRDDLSENKFDELHSQEQANMTEEENYGNDLNQWNTQEIVNDLELQQIQEDFSNTNNNVNSIPNKINSVPAPQPIPGGLSKNSNVGNTAEFYYDNNTLKDPYKETIVPRRVAKEKANDYKGPIGNIPRQESKYVSETRRQAFVDEKYQGKVFLGDSDRIWEAMKKQNRNIVPPKKENNKNLDISNSESNIINQFKRDATTTLEVDTKNIFDPINDVENDDSNASSTVEWDD
ncbi:hypothetical protein SHELI_v1c07270 [Spiroplasma helicoides]|uniref:APC family permease n=1 Tax=Spiroplasma helicoides TaxID=216938 RepID=A0A1B3SL69_9MOLU|nr:APC family permease [Spiroplasma helicoides]AOG60676.1 hypothetical protein SHELI_v1c07270 [Spiroplasma helicoides]